jgi:hypothetical protein
MLRVVGEKVAAIAKYESLETTRRYCEPSRHDLTLAVALIGESELAKKKPSFEG